MATEFLAPRGTHRDSSDSTYGSEPVCRICYRWADEASGPLIAPCCCKGSIGLTHRSCLERWLRERRTDKCNICLYNFKVFRRCQPLRRFFSDPDERGHVAKMIIHFIMGLGDIMVLTFAWTYAMSYLSGKGWFVYLVVLVALLIQTSFWLIFEVIRAWTSYHPIQQWRGRTADLELFLEDHRAPPEAPELVVTLKGTAQSSDPRPTVVSLLRTAFPAVPLTDDAGLGQAGQPPSARAAGAESVDGRGSKSEGSAPTTRMAGNSLHPSGTQSSPSVMGRVTDQ
ncbi:hypothetical protein ISCGN_021227 [Ixodes scapularis]